MIYAAGLAAVLTAGVIHTVIATRELLGCGKEMSAWKAFRIGLRLLPAVMMTSLIGTGGGLAYMAPAYVNGNGGAMTLTTAQERWNGGAAMYRAASQEVGNAAAAMALTSASASRAVEMDSAKGVLVRIPSFTAAKTAAVHFIY